MINKNHFAINNKIAKTLFFTNIKQKRKPASANPKAKKKVFSRILRPRRKPQMIKTKKPNIFERIAREDTKRFRKYKKERIIDTIRVSKIQHNSVNKSERIFFFMIYLTY